MEQKIKIKIKDFYKKTDRRKSGKSAFFSAFYFRKYFQSGIFPKKIRNILKITRKNWLKRKRRSFRANRFCKKAAVYGIISIIITSFLIQGSHRTQGATFIFDQTSWVGGATSDMANHTSNQNDWDEYASKGGAISAGDSVALSSGNSTTANIDFESSDIYLQGDSSKTEFSSGAVSLRFEGNDSYTKLLLHNEGAGNNFADSSPSLHVVTAGGDATQTSAQYKFGSQSAYFDGTGDYLDLTDSDDFDFGSDDFTIDFWAKDLAGNNASVFQPTFSNYGAMVGIISGGNLLVYMASASGSWGILSGFSLGAVPGSAWTHYALVRNGSNFYGFRNGALISTASSAASVYTPAGSANVGRNKNGTGNNYYLSGEVDEFRISKGIARWTSDFDFPASAYGRNFSNEYDYITTSNDSQLRSHYWSEISSISLTQTTPTNTNIKYLVSFDNRSTWKYWNGSNWQASTLDNIGTNGMDKTTLEGLTASSWSASGGFEAGTTATVDFAVGLYSANSYVQPSVDNIAVNYDFFGSSVSSENSDFDSSQEYSLEDSSKMLFDGSQATLRDNDPNTSLLLHANGTGNSITDYSVNNTPVTANGDAVQQSANKKFGDGALYFDGAGDYLSFPNNSQFQFGAGDFTLDFWAKTSSTTTASYPLSFGNYYAEPGFSLRFAAGSALLLTRVKAGTTSGDGSISGDTIIAGIWSHIAIVKTGGYLKLYKDGVLQGTPLADTNSYTSSYDGLRLGCFDSTTSTSAPAYYWKGYLDEVRVSKGVARWSSNFTPSSSEYGSYSNDQYYHITTATSGDEYTKLLLHNEGAGNNFADSSSFNHSITASGNATQTSAQYKFGSQSASFDGAGDYLTIPDSDDWAFGTGDFTIDSWFRLNSLPSSYVMLFSQYQDGNNYQALGISNIGGTYHFNYQVISGGSSILSFDNASYAFSTNTWYHFAIVRNGTAAKIYINGTALESKTNSADLSNFTGSFNLGSLGGSIYYLNGYLDEFRISKGVARWTGDFSVPASAYSASYSSSFDSSDWSEITYAKTSQTTPTNTNIKYLVSFDNRSTWKYWNGSNWQASTLDNIGTNGMDKTTLEGLTASSWSASGGFEAGTTATVDFAVGLDTTDSSVAPLISQIEIFHRGGSASSSDYLISSPFNTEQTYNIVSGISWSGSTPTGSSIMFQLRTAPDNSDAPGTWTSWMGPDGSSDSYFTDSSGNETIPEALRDGVDDQWVQYKVFISSGALQSAELQEVELIYGFNVAPEVQNVTASQGSDGMVNISYDVRDSDTTSGSFTPGYITPSFKYWNGSSWLDCVTLTSGDTNNKTVDETNFTTYTASWNAKTDFGGQYITGTVKIRVTVDDNEAANSSASADSSTFTLDTKNPTSFSFVINHTTNQIVITTPTDDSSFQMAVSRYSNFFGATFENFISPYTFNNMTDDPSTVYVRIKDAYGNYTDANATTPSDPGELTYHDLSNVAESQYQLFIAWNTVPESEVGSGFADYRVYRSTDGSSYSSVGTIADRTVNYYFDTGLEADTTYYYKVVAEDTNGDISAFSSIVSDVPNGAGGSDTTAPTISNLRVSSIQTTSATVTWDTDELSDSFVGYSEDETYLPERGVSSYILNHEIVLTDLSPGTIYNIRIKSRDAAGNLAQRDANSPGSIPIEDFSFETLPGPAISSVTVSSIFNTQATIQWSTTTDSSTYVVYSDELDENGDMVNPIEIGAPDLVGGSTPYAHSQTLSDLAENTRYYFYVKSVDASNNVAIDNNGGDFYELLTTQDDTGPVVSAIDTKIVSDTQAAIYWLTDEQSTSMVKYSLTSGGPYTDSTSNSYMNRSHFVILSYLTPNTKYYYKVVTDDINGNETVSAEYNFTTKQSPELDHDPLSEISNLEVSVVTDQKAVIKFDTDQAAQCSVEYGTESGNYTEVPVNETSYNYAHAIHLTGLIFSTTYYYQISCEDNLETVISSDEGSFTTLEEITTKTDDTTAPAISGVGSGSATGESIIITWTTDEAANSLVKYGVTSDAYASMAGDALVNSDVAEYVKDHTVTINSLTPDTQYYYAVISSDVSGNIAESSQGNFTTNSSSSLSSINIESQSLNEVTITWKSSVKTTSLVEYGTTENYGDSKESSTMITDHSISLSGLISNTLYHFRVKGKDADNNWYSSGDYTLAPKSPPTVSDIRISDITEHGAKVTFSTNVPTDALVTYTSSDNTKSGSQGKPDLAVSHEIDLSNLDSGTNFDLSIKVRDESGNETESVIQSFQTGKDESPPIIDQVKTDSALALSDKVQTIITWNTNEPTDAKLYYREGRDGEEKEINVDSSYSEYHIAVLTAFKPGTVYYFRTGSADQAGNETTSDDYALLTPRKKENIVQIIIGNFEEIFGWARFDK